MTHIQRITTLFLIFLTLCAAPAAAQAGAPALQQLAERLLRGKQGSIVAIEPQTGRILALASRDKVDDGINRAIGMAYSPGSTLKTAQTLALVSMGWLTPDRTYPCHEGFTQDGIHIGCHKHRAPLALVGAIGQSCNSYFCKAFQEYIDDRTFTLTKWRAINRWAAFLATLGLGQRLGVDISGEVGGIVPDSAYMRQAYRSWNGTTIMWMGMGQGEVTATPLQLCNLAALIANRGWYVTPHTAAAPTDSAYLRRHVSAATPEAIDLVVKGMRLCVTGGTAASINTPRYAICGKTGTAENEGADHSIFIGFAPMDQPRVAVSVFVENGGFGADLAAPLAALVIEQALTGKLSAQSERRAERWAGHRVKITPVEVPVTLDDL